MKVGCKQRTLGDLIDGKNSDQHTSTCQFLAHQFISIDLFIVPDDAVVVLVQICKPKALDCWHRVVICRSFSGEQVASADATDKAAAGTVAATEEVAAVPTAAEAEDVDPSAATIALSD